MLVESILSVLFTVINFIIDLLPTISIPTALKAALNTLSNYLALINFFVPVSVISMAIVSTLLIDFALWGYKLAAIVGSL